MFRLGDVKILQIDEQQKNSCSEQKNLLSVSFVCCGERNYGVKQVFKSLFEVFSVVCKSFAGFTAILSVWDLALQYHRSD